MMASLVERDPRIPRHAGQISASLAFVVGLVAVAACSNAPTPVDAAPGDSTPDAVADASVDAPDAPTGLGVLGNGTHDVRNVRVRVVAAERVGLSTPRDLAFHPDHPGMLWVVNYATNSVTIVDDATVAQPVANTRSGVASPHFLARPSAIAFGAPGGLATAQEQDRVTQPTTPATFMGPTLWTSDPAIFNGDDDSHLDMLHNSPNSVGIAWEQGNAYWVVDGAHRSLTRYDFRQPHVLSGTDHSDGDVRRYAEAEIAYVRGVSSCAEWDRDASRLLVADTGNNRIVEFDPQGATRGTAITPNYDRDTQFRYSGGTLATLIDGGAAGLAAPSGLALSGRMLFVTDNTQSRVYAFRRDGTQVDYLDLSSEIASGGLMGIDVAPNGDLYVVDALSNRVLAIAPR